MKIIIKICLFVFLGAASAYGIRMTSSHEANAQAEVLQGQIELDRTTFVVKTWRKDGTHLTAVKGKLTFNGQPVENAVLQSDTSRRSIRTEENGSFELIVDRSLPVYAPIRAVSVQDAKIAGKPIGKKEADLLLTTTSAISVYHPIEVTKTELSKTDGNMIKVHARILSDYGDKVSFFQVDKYRIAGTVTDAGGNPVKDAIVWIDRDRGEGFAKSTPTDQDGKYEMYYWPEEEETNLTVIVGTRRYALPANKVFILPRNTSVDIGIRLPREGTVIEDKPPTLDCKTSMGATYAGLLAGLDVPPEVRYSVTIPDRNGRFVLTVPEEVWKQRPPFYETRITKFVGQEKFLKAGDSLPIGFVQPGDHDPRVIASAAN
ncbi:carboxypeptidase-like regulatory domain-containing protein [Cohnella herbarum]|uniref:Carboxypeptidase regulatory-like domain-containing protein n=1 Tax=Cohnella herbarum TaxID=2728023 RepID=A0A7Z2ZLA9_9BACL|nr:carboxypeptidase-like regulatory domain-containing protein [Cohnella herbarum]QJD82867.1 carboxypeptidase regulatory-like domain-containing protein [Cohnella herbarum]